MRDHSISLTPKLMMLPITLAVSLLGIRVAAETTLVTDNATPMPIESDVAIEPLAGIPFLPALTTGASVSLDRITFPPDSSLQTGYIGPVVYYVEHGILELRYEPGDPEGLGFSGIGGSLTTTPEGFVQLPPGASVVAPDGNLGLTRNAGNEPAVVLAAFVVPEDNSGSVSEPSERADDRNEADESQRRKRNRDR